MNHEPSITNHARRRVLLLEEFCRQRFPAGRFLYRDIAVSEPIVCVNGFVDEDADTDADGNG